METDSLEDYWTELRLVRESRPKQDPDEDNANLPGKSLIVTAEPKAKALI